MFFFIMYKTILCTFMLPVFLKKLAYGSVQVFKVAFASKVVTWIIQKLLYICLIIKILAKKEINLVLTKSDFKKS